MRGRYFLVVGLLVVGVGVLPADADPTNGEEPMDTTSTSDSPPPLIKSGVDTATTPTSFIRTFEVSPEDYLYIHGYQILGMVECKWEKGSPLFINGYQVLPAPNPMILPFSEEELESSYRGNPVVVASVSAGMTWRDAVLDWESRKAEVAAGVSAAYSRIWAVTQSQEAARQAVEDTLRNMSSIALDRSEDVRWTRDHLLIPWQGDKPSNSRGMIEEYMRLPQLSRGDHRKFGPRRLPNYYQALHLVATVRSIVRMSGPSLYVLPSMGASHGLNRSDLSHDEFINEVLSQIHESRSGAIVPGKLREREVEEIIQRGGLDQ